jgi:hypothetical protein
MRTKEVTYERKFALGNYEMETIGICVEVDAGEKFADVLAMCRKAVLSQASVPTRAQSPGVKDLNAVLETKGSS